MSERSISKLKYNYVIVHGTFGHPGENWFPWLAGELAKLDASGKTQREDILIPHFPSNDCADYDSWKSVLLGYIDSGVINKNTIFICHSLGPLFVSRVLIEKKIKVKGMISVEAAANHLMGNPSFDKINSTFFVPSWDYLNQVKKYLDFNYCFYTDNDPHIPFNILTEYIKHAATKAFFIPNAGHFNTASGYSTFPQLLELIKTIELSENIYKDKIEKVEAPTALWNKNLSHTWTNMTWPNRPSISELNIYTNTLRQMQNQNGTRPICLILGSNVEFRDWAYEENLDVSLMQNNEDYHLATYRELRHKNAPFKIILRDWQAIDFENAYDLIVGDELIGNLGSSDIDSFLKHVSTALKPGGYFLSKSFYKPDGYTVKTLEQIFEGDNKNIYNPIAKYIFDLTMAALDQEGFVNFNKILDLIEKANKRGLLSEHTYNTLTSIGLNQMNYKFYVPTLNNYVNTVNKYFVIKKIENTNDVGAENFPIFILQKK